MRKLLADDLASSIVVVGLVTWQEPPVHDAVHHRIEVRADAGKTVNPARDPASTDPLAEIVSEMAAVSSKQVVIVARVLFRELRDQVGDVLRGELRAAQPHGLTVRVHGMALREHGGEPRMRLDA